MSRGIAAGLSAKPAPGVAVIVDGRSLERAGKFTIVDTTRSARDSPGIIERAFKEAGREGAGTVINGMFARQISRLREES